MACWLKQRHRYKAIFKTVFNEMVVAVVVSLKCGCRIGLEMDVSTLDELRQTELGVRGLCSHNDDDQMLTLSFWKVSDGVFQFRETNKQMRH